MGQFDQPTRRRFITAFVEGFLSPLRGFGYMMEHRALWQHAIWPVLLNVLATGVFIVGIVVVQVYFYRWLEFGWAPVWIAWLFELLIGLLLAAVSLGLALVVWLLMQVFLLGHFYGILAKQVEVREGLPPDEMREITLREDMTDSVYDIALMLALLLLVLAIPFVPVAGVAIAPLAAMYIQWMTLGRELLTRPLSVRGGRFRHKLRFTRRHRWHTLGLGAACMLLALVPLLGAVLLCPAVVGSVILHRRLAAADAERNWSWRETAS